MRREIRVASQDSEDRKDHTKREAETCGYLSEKTKAGALFHSICKNKPQTDFKINMKSKIINIFRK